MLQPAMDAIRTLVVDDEKLARDRLVGFLERESEVGRASCRERV